MTELVAEFGPVCCGAEDFVVDLLPPNTDLVALGAEADEVVREIQERASHTEQSYPNNYGVETETIRVLYMIVRARRSEIVVETGVANGSSTLAILFALERNQCGRLISVDINESVGSLLSAEDRLSSRWRLEVIEPGNFDRVVENLDRIDVFFHDSDHSYAGQTNEFCQVRGKMADDGLLLSDDVEASMAFIDVRRRESKPGKILLDGRKMFGGIRLG